jgi:hypothetical protein
MSPRSDLCSGPLSLFDPHDFLAAKIDEEAPLDIVASTDGYDPDQT